MRKGVSLPRENRRWVGWALMKKPICLQPWFCFAMGQFSGFAALASGILAVINQMRGFYWYAALNTLCFGVNVGAVMVQAFVIEKLRDMNHVA